MLSKMKIGSKLIGGFVLCTLILVGVVTYNYVMIQKLRSLQDEGATRSTQAVIAEEGSGMGNRLYRIIADAEINRDLDQSTKQWDEVKKEMTEDLSTIVKNADTPEEKDWARTAMNANDEMIRLFEKEMLPLLAIKNDAKNEALIRDLDAKIDVPVSEIQTVLDKYGNSLGAENQKGDEAFDATAKSIVTISIVLAIIAACISLMLGIFLSRSITIPLTKGVAMMQEMAKGHLGMRLKMARQDEIGILAKAMDDFSEDLQKNVVATVIKIGEGDVSIDLKAKDGQDEITPAIMNTTIALRGLIAEAGMLSKAAVEGKLATRADASKHNGDFRKIVQGVDDCLDAVIGPLNVAAKYVDDISKGNIPHKITDSYNGDFNNIKNNLNQCIDAVNNLVADAGMLSKAAVDGKLATRADATKHWGDFRKVVQGVNECLDSVIGPLNVAAKYVDDISKGNIPAKITDSYNGDFNAIKNNLNQCIDAVNNLVADAGMLAKAAVEGKLATRADAGKHWGDFRKVVQGVNDTLDAVIDPLNVTAKYVDDISKGVIPPTITDNYNGDFNVIKGNLNAVVKMMNELLAETDIIIKAAADGELDKRADAGKFLGGWNKLVSGVNDTITNIVNPLMVTADYVEKVSKGVIPPTITDVYKGQYNLIKNNLNSVVKMMSELLSETDIIIKAAADGELDKRADAEKFQGGWNKLVSGVNDTITNIVNPLMVTADYVEKVSKGIVPPEITTVYKGQYNQIKNNLNAVVKMMNDLLKEADVLITAAVGGALNTRANATLFVGGWNTLMAGINKTLDAVLEPINEAAGILEKVAARDMTARVKGDYKGDHAKIKNSLNTAVDNLDKALTQVAEAVEQVSSASQQISSGSQSLAQGANEQASSLEEVSSSLEEMSSMTKQNAENANQAKNLAGEANKNADVGAESMAKMSDAINKIKESSDQTAKIVKTIDEIAMQTNLLALNAAVEAARAGEAGRGFAVVAEEVRNLAQRSAQAAKNTADMITESVKNAEGGVKIAVEVTKSFESITLGVKKVNDLIAEIAAASGEQSQGIDQVNTAVAQMDKVTQQNAANSEESASAAEELSSQSEELAGMVAQFAVSQAIQKKAVTVRSQQVQQMAAPTHRPMVGTTTHAKSNGNGNGGRKTAGRKKIETLSAEDIIPMDDEVLKEF
jgi:methyl-accepting chemotaxis protein